MSNIYTSVELSLMICGEVFEKIIMFSGFESHRFYFFYFSFFCLSFPSVFSFFYWHVVLLFRYTFE